MKKFAIILLMGGVLLSGCNYLDIVPDVAYLQDNSKMKQMYELAKEVRDWIPGM